MSVQIINGDCREMLKTLPDQSVHCCVTSPPYFGLRDYGHDGQIGLEQTPDAFVAELVAVFREVRRVLRYDGTVWLNLGDSYAAQRGGTHQPAETLAGGNGGKTADGERVNRDRHDGYNPTRFASKIGLKHKDLVGIPWRVAFALQSDGWYLRQDIIWHKPNPMPESVTDRCTKAHEYIFLLSKSAKYYFDNKAIMEQAQYGEQHAKKTTSWGTNRKHPNKANVADYAFAGDNHTTSKMDDGSYGRNKRSVWTVTTKPYKGAHFATFPPDLIAPCILAGCPPSGKRCDCDEIIATPTGIGEIDDPSMETGRAGMNRPRRPYEGTRPITRREQRHEAEEMKSSPHRASMEAECGSAFAHYIRTDASGARPLPEELRSAFKARGWITDAEPCQHQIEPAGTVLDPFGGSGTTGEVAERHGRNAILIELNPKYIDLMKQRTAQGGLGI